MKPTGKKWSSPLPGHIMPQRVCPEGGTPAPLWQRIGSGHRHVYVPVDAPNRQYLLLPRTYSSSCTSTGGILNTFDCSKSAAQTSE